MFRRFMIVCWVLFGIAALGATVSWALYEYSDQNFRQTLIEGLSLEADASDSKVRQEYRGLSDAVRRAVDNLKEWDESITTYEAEGLDDESLIPGSPDTLGKMKKKATAIANATNRLDNVRREAEKHFQRKDSSIIAVFLFGVPALALLCWNLIWHVGHWIWMGHEH